MVSITELFAPYNRNLGNKLFTYAFARIIADSHRYKLQIPKNAIIQRNGIVENFPFKGCDGIEVHQDSISLNDHNTIGKKISDIIKQTENKKVTIDGYFSRYELIKEHKEKIKLWYNDIISEPDNKNDVLIMLRDSNVDPTFKLPDEYYLEILEKLNFENLYVSYDHKSKHTELFRKIEKYNPKYLDLSIIELFKFNTSKKTIIASQGTFSFWVCLLSNSEKIYWPITENGPNRLTDKYVELKVYDDKRYEFIETKKYE